MRVCVCVCWVGGEGGWIQERMNTVPTMLPTGPKMWTKFVGVILEKKRKCCRSTLVPFNG